MVDAGREWLDWRIPDDVPDGRCGFTTEYDIPGGLGPAPNVTCWRESWREHDRCIWHADVSDKPTDELAAARTDDLERLDGAVLREADLYDAVSFAGCWLLGADCTDADLWGADCTDAFLREADLTGADLSNTDLRGASFKHAHLHETYLDDARINTDTVLSPVHAYDLPDRQWADVDGWRDRLRMNAQIVRHYLTPARWRDGDATAPHRSVHIHRKLQQLCRENALPGEVPSHHVREKHARRRESLKKGGPPQWLPSGNAFDSTSEDGAPFIVKWLPLAGARWTTLYGESPWRVVATALVVIAAGVLLYPITGLDLSGLDRLYFSVATFTPLMPATGLPAPTTEATKIVAMTQALLGVALTALLVAVLDRRITR